MKDRRNLKKSNLCIAIVPTTVRTVTSRGQELLYCVLCVLCCLVSVNQIISPVTGLERPRGFQEVNVPRFHDNGTGWW